MARPSAENKSVKPRKRPVALMAALILIAAALLLWVIIDHHEGASKAHLSDGVLIDPGHGGEDVGAIAPNSGVYEDKLNLEVSLALQAELDTRGAEAELTRKDGNALGETKDLDMQERARLIGESESGVMVSIHMNSFPADPNVWGPQVFYQEGSSTGRALAECIQKELNKVTGGTRKTSADNLFVLRAAQVPAVLVECGFLTNPEEDQKLQDPEYQRLIANAIAEGIADYCD
ncbi:MAG: N-acetylmuramoyl-L-alanine amidase [Clostridia bacterium]|nr:N-acetylmuramoyl-L-alanine amidase [Clostridia bacterium]